MHIVRLKTLITYVVLTLVVLAIIIFLIVSNSRPRKELQEAAAAVPIGHYVILDAGHGGMDGGAVSSSGTEEAPINLAITLKAQCIFKLFGIDSVLTRADDSSLNYNPDASIRENKNADLKARLQVAENNPDVDFMSIHLNKFEQEKYSGAQVFYSPNRQESRDLAEFLQASMGILDPQNQRKVKMAPDTVFLMKNIKSPAVTIECGFLSNANEESLLKTDAYQSKVAIAIAAGYINYLEG